LIKWVKIHWSGLLDGDSGDSDSDQCPTHTLQGPNNNNNNNICGHTAHDVLSQTLTKKSFSQNTIIYSIM